VLVLAVGAETDPQAFSDKSGKDASRGERQSALTLSLKLPEAQLLALARERGALSVALRNPDDDKVVERLPDMLVSGLLDSNLRADVQRARSPSNPNAALPERITTEAARP
jgi:pilus assembly protein CpaB